jgi:hypothetical protein
MSGPAAGLIGDAIKSHSKTNKILGLSKMVVKSIIFALVGLLIQFSFKFMQRGKIEQLQAIQK